MRNLCRENLAATLVAAMLAAGCARQIPPAAAPTGGRAIATCLGCHSAISENRPTGPNLHGLVGRKAGTRPGYFYSEPMRNSGITWDAATLDRFLGNPSAMVPGTFMMAAVSDAGQRAEIVRYLVTLQPQ